MESIRFLPLPQVQARTSVCKATLYELIREGQFPKPIKLGRKSVWLEAEVDQWMRDRIAEREAA